MFTIFAGKEKTMAKYTVHHTCGHDNVIDIPDDATEAFFEQIKYLDTLPCDECGAAQEAKNADKTE